MELHLSFVPEHVVIFTQNVCERTPQASWRRHTVRRSILVTGSSLFPQQRELSHSVQSCPLLVTSAGPIS